MCKHSKKPSVICPHCDHEFTTDEMIECTEDLFALAPNEETTSLQCPACDSDFFVKGGYTPFYSTAFAEELL